MVKMWARPPGRAEMAGTGDARHGGLAHKEEAWPTRQ
jgi:hypothetical protein